VDRVTGAPGAPYHTLINADNFHALQLLLYCYEGQVDAIYIDPPYNSGADHRLGRVAVSRGRESVMSGVSVRVVGTKIVVDLGVHERCRARSSPPSSRCL
jgi:hypothetical protein